MLPKTVSDAWRTRQFNNEPSLILSQFLPMHNMSFFSALHTSVGTYTALKDKVKSVPHPHLLYVHQLNNLNHTQLQFAGEQQFAPTEAVVVLDQ